MATNLDTPWEILWGPDDHIWLTERYGRVSRLDPATGELTELITIDEVHETGESGLLGMALHPSFDEHPTKQKSVDKYYFYFVSLDYSCLFNIFMILGYSFLFIEQA